jgi:E3 ubiquitin-protein ligase BRE1|tara:strand:- start:378 stop:1061 length:684 start_codon:yes stop_codon:yes gene_type:complete
LKRLKKERVGVSNEKDKLKQTLSLSKQSNSVLKDEARLSRRAEEMATSYAKQQESKLKSIQDKLNTLNEEKQMLEREVGQFRAAEVGSVNQDGAFAGIQQLNSAKTKEITDLKSNVEDFKHKIKRLTETNVTIQRDLDRKNRQIQQAQGDIGKMKVTELKELYGEMETCLKCPVVPTRWKNCIITKCGHMFADESLKEQLEKRNRKCPTCNLKYDKQEIMSISLYSA